MSLHRHHSVRSSEAFLGRRRQAKRSALLRRSCEWMETLEKRRLLSGYAGYTFTVPTGDTGAQLQSIINGQTLLTGDGQTNHTLTLGDTLILPAGQDYNMGNSELYLPNLGAAATVSAAQINGSGGVTGATVTYGGAGCYDSSNLPSVVFFGGSGSGATGQVVLAAGPTGTDKSVVSISITNAGTGYTATGLPQIAIVGGAGTLTIESSGAGSLGSGRFTPTLASVTNLATISGNDADGIIQTELSDNYNHGGADQNYTFWGIEMCPNTDTQSFSAGLVNVGIGGGQNYNQLVPNNFTFDQDYIHGGTMGETSDDLNITSMEDGTIATGLVLNANYVTVENTQVSDIHGADNTIETHGISAWNALGNFTINNNYFDASSEDLFFGGAHITLPSPDQPNNITITNNTITKDLAWNPNLPQFAGVAMDVKNDIEFKTATNVTVSNNLIENVWNGADQRGEAISLSHIDQDFGTTNQPWINDAYITITDNVFRNVGQVVAINAGEGDQTGADGYGPTEISHDITFSNNLAYDIGGPQWGIQGDEWAIQITATVAPTNNITIENNTIIGTNGILWLESNNTSTVPAAANFVCENNVFDESTSGIGANDAGSDAKALNSHLLGALTITNPGSDYSSIAPPTVTISASPLGGTNTATATAIVCAAGYPQAGEIIGISITDYGAGYTSVPTVSISGTGGATAVALFPVNDDGSIHGYDFQNNLIIGGTASNYPDGGADNYFPTTENAVQILDPAGEEYGLLSTSPYHSDGTGGSIPGINMTTLLAADSTGTIPWTPADAANSLQNYYKFNEGSGTIAHDNGLGTHENATLNGTYTWNTTGPAGGGITLSGGNTGNISVSSFTADASFTFAAWVKPASTSGTQYIASTANSAFSLYLSAGVLTAKGTTGTATGTTLTAGQWSLVSVTYSSGTLTLYVNGAEVGSTTSATTTTGTTTLYIGGDQGSVSTFNGTLDEVRYYSTSLTQTMSVIGDTNLGLAGGSGYNSGTSGFAITFIGGGGSGAAATAYADNSLGEITSIITTNTGSGYTAAPTLSFTNGGGVGALDTAAMSVTPLSYLYSQYGTQFENTWAGESGPVTGTSVGIDTSGLSSDENPSSLSFVWSNPIYPSGGIHAPTVGGQTSGGSAWDTSNPTVDFNGAGNYLFQCVVTNSLGQSNTIEFPVTVDAVSNTNVVFVNPANVSLAPNAGKTFNVNGTSIAILSGIVDQFGNAMPSSGWSWSVIVESPSDGTITSNGVYTAPNRLGSLGSVVHLGYTTPDGVYVRESTASVTVVDASTPSAPATVTVTPGTSNSNVIAWTAPVGGGETGYDVYQSTDGTYDGIQIYSSTNLSTLSFTDNLTTDPNNYPAPGGTYYYYVTAFNANGEGAPAPSPEPAGIVTGAPAVPTSLVATGNFNTSVNLTWINSATNATGIDVLRSTDSDFDDAIQVANLAGNSTGWTDDAANDPAPNSPVEGTTYYYWVETYNAYTSLPSNVSSGIPLGAPTGLTATAIASNQISASWVDPSGGLANFYLQYENANGGSWSSPISIPAGTTSYLLTTGLSADTQYNWEVEAYTVAGNSGWSAPVSTRTWNSNSSLSAYEGFNYPVPPGSSTPLGGQSGGIGWSGAWTAESNYTLFLPGLTDTNSTVAANLLTTGDGMQSYNSGQLATRTLSSTVGGGTSTLWASALVNLPNLTGGSVHLIGTSGTNTTTIYVGFDAAADKFGVNINDGTWTTASTSVTAGDTYLLVFELKYGSTNTLNIWVDPNPSLPSSSWTLGATLNYTTSLPAISSVGFWTGSGGTNGTVFLSDLRVGSGTNSSVVTPLAQPNVPTGLTAIPSANNIVLSWTAPTEPSGSSLIQGYDIWRSTNGGVSYGNSSYATVGSSTLSYTDASVSAGTTYYYEVTAENTTSDSVNSNVSSAMTSPAVPSTPTATPATNAISIALTWTDTNSGSGTDYNIQRSTSGTGSWTTVATSVTNTSWTDNASNDPGNTPVGNTTYYYQVNAYYTSNPSNPSAWSPTSSQALTIPAAPTGLAATPGTNSIALTWSDPSSTTNITKYNIWRSTDDASWGATPYGVATGATATSYTDAAPASGVSYYYEVTAYDTTGNSAPDAIPGGLSTGVATVDASEEFNYAINSVWTGANTTGIGFTGNWTVNYTNHASIVAGLTYSSGTNALTVSGNALEMGYNNYGLKVTQTLNNSIGTAGTTLWVGFLMNTNTPAGDQFGLYVGTSTTTGDVHFGSVGNNNLDEGITTNTGKIYTPNSYAGTANTIYFIVGEIQYLATSPVITMYVDPTPNSANGATPTGALATLTQTIPSTSGSLSSTTALEIYSDDVAGTFDELRLGSTYASVALDPIVTGASNKSGTSTHHRPSHSQRTTPFLAGVATPKVTKATRPKPSSAKPNLFYTDLNGGAWQWTSAGDETDSVFLSAPSKQGLFN